MKKIINKYGLETSNYVEKASSKELRDYYKFKILAWFGKALPNKVLGLDITPAKIDLRTSYKVERTLYNKKIADDRFYRNMKKIIDKDSISVLRWLRKRRAWKYYLAVKYFGFASFIDDRSSDDVIAEYNKYIDKKQYRTINGLI